MKIWITFWKNSSEEKEERIPYIVKFPKTQFDENLAVWIYKLNGFGEIGEVAFSDFEYNEQFGIDMKKQISDMLSGKGIEEINKIVKQLEVVEYFGKFPQLEYKMTRGGEQTGEEILQEFICELYENEELGYLIPESLL